jgi:hypothetical protein
MRYKKIKIKELDILALGSKISFAITFVDFTKLDSNNSVLGCLHNFVFEPSISI